MTRFGKDHAARFMSYIAKGAADECWLWLKSRDTYGYPDWRNMYKKAS